MVTGATTTAAGVDVSGTTLFNDNPRATTTNIWGSSIGGFKNLASLTLGYPATVAQQTNAADRALGVFQTGSYNLDPSAAFELAIANTTGFTTFNLSFNFMILSNYTRTTTWTVDYQVGGSGAFTALGTIAAGPGNPTDTLESYSFGTALDNQSGQVILRVAALTGSTGSGNRDEIAIDNVDLTYAAVPEPSTVLLVCMGLVGILVIRRRCS